MKVVEEMKRENGGKKSALLTFYFVEKRFVMIYIIY